MKTISKTHLIQLKQKASKKSWWIPVWKGLVSNGKHRKNMGNSIWLYLYLLFSVNRKKGTITKKQKVMAEEMNLSLRTIQNYLLRLKRNNYIVIDNQSKPAVIRITKYKLFYQKDFNNSEILKTNPNENLTKQTS